MAGKKDKAVVAIISGLTDNQATQITKDILKSKQKNAPLGKGNSSIRVYVKHRCIVTKRY